MPAIHQFVAGFSNGDAISNEARILRRVFRSWGYASDIFSESRRILPELRKEARDISDCIPAVQPEDIVLLHLSIGSPVNSAFSALSCRKAILYHNVTPSHYFDFINKQTAHNLAKGREELKALVGTASVVMADSRFNADELEMLGYRDPRVFPLILDLNGTAKSVDRKILRRFNDGKTNILFVGRCAPNKKLEDILQAFFVFCRTAERHSRLIHVGSFAGVERYYYLLLARAREMGMCDIHFAGAVPQSQLNAYYHCANLFLCMSEHEGFCIPLLESMAHDLPVMAYASAAVPETMDGAGILFHDKAFEPIAEMMYRVTNDSAFRDAVIEGQRQRITRYRSRDLEGELKQHLSPLLQMDTTDS